MKKILFICDGDHFSEGAFRFIRKLRENETLFVKGLFFTEVDTDQLVAVGFIPNSGPYAKMREEESLSLKKSQEKFSGLCNEHGIRFQVHPNHSSWDKDLFIRESRFADLVVISEQLFSNAIFDIQPNYYMVEALHSSECPVMVIPDNFESIDRLAIAYDGGKEAMFALKQFAYLFPELTSLPAEFVHASDETSERVPDHDLLLEYTGIHFESLHTSRLHFDPKKYFSAWLENKKNVCLVAGSYSRSSLSNTFRQSFSDRIIAEKACPVFISHFS